MLKKFLFKFICLGVFNKNLIVYDVFFKNYKKDTINIYKKNVYKKDNFLKKYNYISNKKISFDQSLKFFYITQFKNLNKDLFLNYFNSTNDLFLKRNIYTFYISWVYSYYNKKILLTINNNLNFKLNYYPFFYNFKSINLTKNLLFYKLDDYYTSNLYYNYIYKFKNCSKKYYFNQKDTVFLKHIKGSSIEYTNYIEDFKKINSQIQNNSTLDTKLKTKTKDIKSNFYNIVNRNMSINNENTSLLSNIKNINFIYIYILFILILNEERKYPFKLNINRLIKILSLHFLFNNSLDFSYFFIEQLLLNYTFFYFRVGTDYKLFYTKYFNLKFFNENLIISQYLYFEYLLIVKLQHKYTNFFLNKYYFLIKGIPNKFVYKLFPTNTSQILFITFLKDYIFIKFFFFNLKRNFTNYYFLLTFLNILKILVFNSMYIYTNNNFYLNYYYYYLYLNKKVKYYTINAYQFYFFKEKFFKKKIKINLSYRNIIFLTYYYFFSKFNLVSPIKKKIVHKNFKFFFYRFNTSFLLKKRELFLSNSIDTFFNKNYILENYFTSNFLKINLININYLISYNVLSYRKIFIFTTSFLSFGLNFLNYYINNLFFYKLLFFSNNYWKWLYFYIKLNNIKKRVKKLINFKRYSMSNIIFPFYLNKYKYRALLGITKKKFYNKFSSNFNLFFITYLKKFFFKNYLLVFNSYVLPLSSYKIRLSLFYLIKTTELINLRQGYKKEFFKVVFFTYETGDPKILLKWICKSLTELNYKKHWTFLVNIRIILSRVFNCFFFKHFNGICIIVKGKIGSVGSVRKKVFYIKLGSFSQSKFYTYGDELYSHARTKTGKIGVKIITNYFY